MISMKAFIHLICVLSFTACLSWGCSYEAIEECFDFEKVAQNLLTSGQCPKTELECLDKVTPTCKQLDDVKDILSYLCSAAGSQDYVRAEECFAQTATFGQLLEQYINCATNSGWDVRESIRLQRCKSSQDFSQCLKRALDGHCPEDKWPAVQRLFQNIELGINNFGCFIDGAESRQHCRDGSFASLETCFDFDELVIKILYTNNCPREERRCLDRLSPCNTIQKLKGNLDYYCNLDTGRKDLSESSKCVNRDIITGATVLAQVNNCTQISRWDKAEKDSKKRCDSAKTLAKCVHTALKGHCNSIGQLRLYKNVEEAITWFGCIGEMESNATGILTTNGLVFMAFGIASLVLSFF